MAETTLRTLALEGDAVPGRGAHLAEARGAWPTAAPRLADLDHVDLRSGPAWADAGFQAELHAFHRGVGAGDDSFDALRALAGGAPCVVTGQQPGLLGGPLYTTWKILGAIALARELTRRRGRAVVPVYWCGSDDSDFDEVRRVWVRGSDGRAYRGGWPRAMWEAGQRVGSVRGGELAEVERALLERMGRAMPPLGARDDLDVGERMAALVLGAFPGHGLVVVDARSETLRTRGHELFRRYARRHRDVAAALRDRAEELERKGWPVAFDSRATESGLFALRGERRAKLGPEELDRLDGPEGSVRLAPSVLLRPLWQDEQLAPVAAVLGPGEVQYHAQLAPAYAMLEVAAARPVSRPHATLWPEGMPWPESADEQRTALQGEIELRAWLAERAMPARWTQALASARARHLDVVRELAPALDDAELRHALEDLQRRADSEWARLRERARGAALRRGGNHDTSSLFVRGVPQERALAAVTARQVWGSRYEEAVEMLMQRYVDAVDADRTPAWLLREGDA